MHVVILSWRDLRSPEGGGAEIYLHHVARRLVQAGHSVTVACAAHDAAPADEQLGGVTYRRRGGKLSVYPAAWLALAVGRLGRPDVVVDVQNGMPFLSTWATRRPVVVLVHHVHKEQWPIVYGRAGAALGWWIESWLAPRLYRRSRYVTVSRVTRDELAGLGVAPARVDVVYNGVDPPTGPAHARASCPSLVVLARLVPHKQVEHVLETVRHLRADVPDLHLDVVGSGWWEPRLRERAQLEGLDSQVTFHGHVDEMSKTALLASAWVHVTASLKEGWGLSVMEAASLGVPTVAYRSAGGVAESVVHGDTGLLVDDGVDALAEGVRLLLTDHERRAMLGRQAQLRSHEYSWYSTAAWFEKSLWESVAGVAP